MHTRLDKKVILGVLAGLAIGILGSAIGANKIAYGQSGGSRGRAVCMVAKPSLLQEASSDATARTLFDPDFYVLYEDGTIKKKSGPF